MNITLIRHGQVMFSDKKKINGFNNVKLSQRGVFDTLNLRDDISENHYDICFMSPLARCVETAFLLVGDRVLTQTDDRLLERNMGNFVGKSYNNYNSKKYWDYNLNLDDEGVEPIQDLFKRCNDFLDEIKKKYKDKDVMVVSHEAVIRVLYCIINDVDVNSNLKEFEIPTSYIKEFKI